MEKVVVQDEMTKEFDNMKGLEREILMAYEDIPDISLVMFAEAKVLGLEKIVADLRKENNEM